MSWGKLIAGSLQYTTHPYTNALAFHGPWSTSPFTAGRLKPIRPAALPMESIFANIEIHSLTWAADFQVVDTQVVDIVCRLEGNWFMPVYLMLGLGPHTQCTADTNFLVQPT